ncbi:hypothetical protein GQX74_003195 [Glossina fuscipes]|nr:hypothetical protein GQX74_003195 [Glossina fuscipes]
MYIVFCFVFWSLLNSHELSMYNNNDKNIITISIERQKVTTTIPTTTTVVGGTFYNDIISIIFLQANGTSYGLIVYLTDKQAFVIIALA